MDAQNAKVEDSENSPSFARFSEIFASSLRTLGAPRFSLNSSVKEAPEAMNAEN